MKFNVEFPRQVMDFPIIFTYLLFNIYSFIFTFIIFFFVVSPISSNAKYPQTHLIKGFVVVVYSWQINLISSYMIGGFQQSNDNY